MHRIQLSSVSICCANIEKNYTQLEGLLPNEEVAYIKTLKTDKRRREYTASRLLIYKELNLQKTLQKDAKLQTIWPNHMLGSISHSSTTACFTHVPSSDHWGVGIDIESIQRLKAELSHKLLNKSEINLLERLSSDKDSFQKMLTIAFTSKEALFKTHFPEGKIMFYFHDVQIVDIDIQNKCVSIELLKATSKHSPKSFVTKAFWSEQIEGEILSLVKEAR